MLTILLMCLGVLVGKFLFPERWSRANGRLQVVLTVLLIFTMGVSIGRNDDLLGNIASIGLDSALFCVVPMAVSVVLVYLVTRRMFGAGEGE